jgi:hypothetical protein
MSVATTIYLQSATWNSITFNSTSGGPIRGEYSHAGEPYDDRTADNEYPTFLAVINKRLIVKLHVREVKQTAALGTKSNLVMTLIGKSSSVTINAANMVLIAVEPAEQSRAEAGHATFVFQHESADGTTVPIS